MPEHDAAYVIDLIQANLPPFPPPAPADPIAELGRQIEMVSNLPEVPYVIIARHDVPYGRAYKMYDTNGHLIVYANRGELADLPHQSASRVGYLGIPVVIE